MYKDIGDVLECASWALYRAKEELSNKLVESKNQATPEILSLMEEIDRLKLVIPILGGTL